MKSKIQNYAKFGLIVFYSLAITTHLLVIAKIIPFDLVNGGRSVSYNEQLKLSVVSLLLLVTIGGYLLKLQKKKHSFSSKQTIVLYLITIFWTLGLVMQLAGTNFERLGLSWVLLLGIWSHISLIRQSK